MSHAFFLSLIPEPTSASATKSVTWAERRTSHWSSLAAASQAGEAHCSSAARYRATSTGNAEIKIKVI